MLMFLYFLDIAPTHKGGHVTTQQSPLYWSSPPNYLPILRFGVEDALLARGVFQKVDFE